MHPTPSGTKERTDGRKEQKEPHITSTTANRGNAIKPSLRRGLITQSARGSRTAKTDWRSSMKPAPIHLFLLLLLLLLQLQLRPARFLIARTLREKRRTTKDVRSAADRWRSRVKMAIGEDVLVYTFSTLNNTNNTN